MSEFSILTLRYEVHQNWRSLRCRNIPWPSSFGDTLQRELPFISGLSVAFQTSMAAFQRIMNHIESGKKQGATLHLGGERHGIEGFYIKPTIFTDVTPDMTIVKEEIFGPGGCLTLSLSACSSSSRSISSLLSGRCSQVHG